MAVVTCDGILKKKLIKNKLYTTSDRPLLFHFSEFLTGSTYCMLHILVGQRGVTNQDRLKATYVYYKYQIAECIAEKQFRVKVGTCSANKKSVTLRLSIQEILFIKGSPEVFVLFSLNSVVICIQTSTE